MIVQRKVRIPKVQNTTFSLAQDLAYNATGGKNWTTFGEYIALDN